MEHRRAPRHSIHMRTLIYKDGLPLAIGRLRNVSRRGVFVASAYDNVAPDQKLEI